MRQARSISVVRSASDTVQAFNLSESPSMEEGRMATPSPFGQRHSGAGIFAGVINVESKTRTFKDREHIVAVTMGENQWLIQKIL